MMLSIADAFVDRTVPGASLIEIEKIAHHYRQWKLAQADADNAYQVSREWLPIYEKYMGEVMQALFRNPTNWGKDPRKYQLDHHEFLCIQKYSTI